MTRRISKSRRRLSLEFLERRDCPSFAAPLSTPPDFRRSTWRTATSTKMATWTSRSPTN